jgi:hypothetical protein
MADMLYVARALMVRPVTGFERQPGELPRGGPPTTA